MESSAAAASSPWDAFAATAQAPGDVAAAKEAAIAFVHRQQAADRPIALITSGGTVCHFSVVFA